MSNSFIDTIQQAIDSQYHLSRVKKGWILEESYLQTKIRTPNIHSIAFSLDHNKPKPFVLDHNKSKPFAFFSDSPPADFAKMCDAVLFCFHGNKTYLFLIEVKTGNKADYEKQLINGKLFCDWLIALSIQHKSLDPNTIVVPLLIWKPRQNSVCKGTTTHHEDSDDIEKMKLSQFDGTGFEIKHCETVPIVKLISKLEKA